MKILDIIKSLNDFRENTIIGPMAEKEIVDLYYKDIPAKAFNYILCGELAELFKIKLEVEHLITEVRRIFIWSDLIVNQFDYNFNKKYIIAVTENNKSLIKKYERSIIFDKEQKGTHAVLELVLDGKAYVVDPTVGIVYPNSMETLVSYKNSHNSYRYMDQYKYMLNSIHMVRPYMFVYATPAYLSHIQSWHYRDRPLVNLPVLDNYVDYFKRRVNGNSKEKPIIPNNSPKEWEWGY